MSNEKKKELELLLNEWPNIQSKQKTISKALESLNIASLRDQIAELDQKKADKSDLTSIVNGSSASGGQLDKLTAQIKKVGQQVLQNYEHINERHEKDQIKFNETVYQLDKNTRQIDYVENVINNMKKRMTDLQK